MVHQYQLMDYHIVLDTCSGSIHAVDDVMYAMISGFPHREKEELLADMQERFGSREDVDEKELEDCYEMIRDLVNQGKLYSQDQFAADAGRLKEQSGNVIKALCLHVAHSCNLTCAYCFAGQGKYHGQRALMSFEVGKQALDFLVRNSGSRTNLEVDFFGGEPLMNWEVVRELVEYARSIEKEAGKNFRFTLTTNGVLLDDEIMDFCNREMSNVVLSLDGRKKIHDKYRVDATGRGSYDLAVKNFRRFVELRGGKNYYIRGTFTHENPDFMQDVLHMLDLGFRELSMEPVVCSPEEPSALTEEDLERVKQAYEELAGEMIRRKAEGKPFTFYHYMLDLKGGPCIYKRISGCGSGTEYLAVTPEGKLFPCHQFVGDPAYEMGDVFQGVSNDSLRERFRQVNAYSRPQCRECWAQLYCSGGCAANAYHASGEIEGIYEPGCELFRKRMECAILVQVDEAIRQEED